jgi:hypothetical protein
VSKLAALLLFCLVLAVGALFAGAFSGSAVIAGSAALPLLGAWVLLTAYDWIRADLHPAAIGARRLDHPDFLSWGLLLLSVPFSVLLLSLCAEATLPQRLFGAVASVGVWIALDILSKGFAQAATATPSRAPCADPAECGSDWCAGIDVGSPTVAVACCRCGRTGMLDGAELVPGGVMELPAGRTASHG